ncbi:hypothetical protein N7G274_002647 [Stereocaulon virgatum]|uniref:Smr domain-containing protein n=1 Tax=Stereocaulon virgatum TaxID=373712 RepID=A0ABR4AGC8_9LECA
MDDEEYLCLEKEYCPPIDTSLFAALYHEHTSNNAAIYELRTALDSIKEIALADNVATFDPSGTSGWQDDERSHFSSERAQSWHGDATSIATEETDPSTISQALRSVDLAGNSTKDGTNGIDLSTDRDWAELQALEPTEKTLLLKEMFHDAKDFDISYILKKANNDIEKAVDELLNQTLLTNEDLDGGDTYIRKGIEAFTEPSINARGRKSRRKQKQILRRTSSTPVPAAPIIPQYLRRAPSPTSNSQSACSSSNYVIPPSRSTDAALRNARMNALTQAQAAHRKAKSNPLHGGIAAYYSSEYHESSAMLRQVEAVAADELVTRQSKPGEVDLHGVNVEDAKRITHMKVEQWWLREGLEWARAGKVMGDGLRIITGIGRHSESGKGKLGPAVKGMLSRDGWKIEEGQGVLEVVGKVRR